MAGKQDDDGDNYTFTPKQISSSSEFKTRLMYSGATWLGTQKHLDQIILRQTEGLKTVETIDFLGYSRDHQAYIFNDIAIHKGSIFKANDEDYFEFGKQRVKCLMKSVKIKNALDAKGYREDWLRHLWTCFGENGVLALTYWFGSLFAEQIRAEHESFPFLEMSGEPDSGKTTLIKFLWKLFGRMYACERYEQITGHLAPVNGGRCSRLDPQLDRETRMQISYELGHGRVDVVAAYIGGQG